MEPFFQIRADQFLVLIMKPGASYHVTIALVTDWKAKVWYPAWKVDRGVQMLQRRFARVQHANTHIFVLLTK